MSKILLLDIGMTVYIKNNQGSGMINPIMLEFIGKIPDSIRIIPLSDTSLTGVPRIIVRDFPRLSKTTIYVKERFPWINKEDPETYLKVCKLEQVDPNQCVFVDDREEFRSAARKVGILAFGVSREEVDRCLTYLIK